MIPVGIRSLAVQFPSTVRTNDYFRERYPEVLQTWEEKNIRHMFSGPAPADAPHPFDAEMAPYLPDVFRGAVERRALAPGETTLSLERQAAEQAIVAAGLRADDIDLLICSSFVPQHLGIGDAAYLAGELGLSGAAFNLESACAGSIVALQTACALVRAGEFKHVLVVVSTTYSRAMDESDILSWFIGDGMGAFVVSAVEPGTGLLGIKTVHTAESCGALYWEAVNNPGGSPHIWVKSAPHSGKMLRDQAVPTIERCCRGAVEAAGVRMEDIDFFIFPTPLAWYHRFTARVLGVDPQKTLSTFTRYGNIGPALTTANLHQAASEGLIREGSLILAFGIGSVSSAGAAVMRWGNVGLGPAPR